MKTCKKCGVEKELTEFYKDKKNKIDGCFYVCKKCNKEYRYINKERDKNQKKEYYKKNKKKIDLRNKKYNKDNNYTKKYYSKNKKDLLSKNKKYYNNNREKILLQKKEYQVREKTKIAETKKIYTEKNREKINNCSNKNYHKRMKIDPLFKIKKTLRSRTLIAFKCSRWNKRSTTYELLGCDWLTAHNHLEKQFTEGMNWDNQGKWHIDHIIPLASAKNEDELMKLCHYKNLQPLWAEDNLRKGAKIQGQQTYFKL